MHFTVLPPRSSPPTGAISQAFLITDNWNDWWQYFTQYYLIYCDTRGDLQGIGHVKIGEFNMIRGRPSLPEHFRCLDDNFFSLGQDDSYYEALNFLGEDLRDSILRGLRDVALDGDLFARALDEQVTGISLLRSVERATVEGQFRRLATGGSRLSRYNFVYCAPSASEPKRPAISLSFSLCCLIGTSGSDKPRSDI